MVVKIKEQVFNTTTKHLNQNKMKQTAVEWLAKEIQEQLNMFFSNATLYQPTIEQAKEMEKEQQKDYDFYKKYWEIRNKKK
jgi:hypothetical protein